MRKTLISITSVAFIFLSLTTIAFSQMAKTAAEDIFSQIELFTYALTTIQTEYVDEKTPQDLIYGSLRGMLGSLDAHSQFMDAEEYAELKTDTQGKFGGLGIEISIKDGLLTVISPIEDTPAWNAGIKAGDRIVKIEDELTRDITLSEAVKKLRGEPGTEINITVLREDEFKILDFTIKREVIQIQDVKDVQVLRDEIGYIRLTEFRENSAEEFHKALEKLKEEGANSLILDLRNNPGGLLNVAIEITEDFLPKGSIIVSTKGRRASQDEESIARSTSHKILDWPVVVMINKGSASGSEILAGALKDNKRAIILGTQSYGKGSVQSVIPLPDGSGLRLTTSKYFTPSGVSIHGTGITPDIVVERVVLPATEEEDVEKDIDDLFNKVEQEEAEDPATIKMTQVQKERRKRLLDDNQVQSAMNVIRGIRVYKNMAAPGEALKPEAMAAQAKPAS